MYVCVCVVAKHSGSCLYWEAVVGGSLEVRSLKPVWEAEVGGSRGQEIETILTNMVKPRLY